MDDMGMSMAVLSMSASLPLPSPPPHTWRVPGTHDDPPVVGVGSDGVDDLSQLVHSLPTVVCVHVHVVGSKVAPLETIHRAQVTWNGMEPSFK